MRKLLSISVIVLVALAIMVVPALAITNNWVEDNDHPFVGLVVYYDVDGEFVWRCSGSLISPTKFVTAGHCSDTAEGAASARVYFQQDAGANYDPVTQVDPVSGYPEYCAAGTLGTLCATSDELYNYGFANFAGFPNTHDVGLVILDQPISMPEYGVLPDAGEQPEGSEVLRRRAAIGRMSRIKSSFWSRLQLPSAMTPSTSAATSRLEYSVT